MQKVLKDTRAYKLLKTEGEKARFSHAYLLSFADARMLKTALKAFAKVLLDCDEPTSPSQKRRAELIDEENFSDCLFYPESGKKLLVEDAEKILEESTLAPVEGEKKLFVLGDFAEANVQTQNKLLKVLEEPPKGVYFLLGTTSTFPVLPTVLSRTKSLEITDFSVEEVAACLRRVYANEYQNADIELCAAASGGKIGEACSMLEGGSHSELVQTAFSLLLSPSHRLPALIKQAGETTHKKELLTLLRLLCRDALLSKVGLRKGLLLKTEENKIAEIADKYEARALLFAQEELSNAEKQVQFNAVFPQCLELCIANIEKENTRKLW